VIKSVIRLAFLITKAFDQIVKDNQKIKMGLQIIKVLVSKLIFQKIKSHSGNKGNFKNSNSFTNLLVNSFLCGKCGKCGKLIFSE
jgi:hypothetical protein